MNHIQIKIDHQMLTARTERPLVARSVGITSFTAEFDESWEGYVKTIIFTAGSAGDRRSKAVLYTGGEAQVPWEVLEEPGELSISACGAAEGRTLPTAMMETYLRVWPNGETVGEASGEAEPEAWQQVLTEVGMVREGVQAVEKAVEDAGTAAENAAESKREALGCLDSARQAKEGAEKARDTAVSAAERVLSSAFLSVKVNGETLPIKQNAVDIPVPTEQSVREQASSSALEALAPVRMAVVTLRSSGWSASAPYTQTVAVPGITEAWIPGAAVLAPTGSMAGDLEAEDALGCVHLVTSGNGQLRFTCYEEKPGVDISIRIPGLLA